MKLETMVIGGGLALIIGVSAIAIVADDLFEDEYHDAPPIIDGLPAPLGHKKDGRDKIVCNSCHVIMPRKGGGPAIARGAQVGSGTPPIALGAPIPPSHKDGRNKMVCQNCHEILPRGEAKTRRNERGDGRNERRDGKAAAGATPPITRNAPIPASHKDGRDKMACQNCHKILPSGPKARKTKRERERNRNRERERNRNR